jgi:hypothetical protein
MVNASGRRFANEAANYNAFGGAFHQFDASRFEYPNLPSYMVFDPAAIDRFGVLGGAPDSRHPTGSLAPTPRVARRKTRPEDTVAALPRLREAGATDIAVTSARNGLTTLDQHLDFIAEVKARADTALR